MTALVERVEAVTETTPPSRPFLSGVFWLIVTAGLIYCHGCHAGDHDDELSVPFVEQESSADCADDTD